MQHFPDQSCLLMIEQNILSSTLHCIHYHQAESVSFLSRYQKVVNSRYARTCECDLTKPLFYDSFEVHNLKTGAAEIEIPENQCKIWNCGLDDIPIWDHCGMSPHWRIIESLPIVHPDHLLTGASMVVRRKKKLNRKRGGERKYAGSRWIDSMDDKGVSYELPIVPLNQLELLFANHRTRYCMTHDQKGNIVLTDNSRLMFLY